METSLRLRGGGGLRIHAKEKLPLGYNSLLQAHGEVDTTGGGPGPAPSYLALFVRHFYPQRKRTGAIELAWTILDFRKGQDVRLKLGYELYHKVPYFQLRENNWTLNGYMDGNWNVRFDM
ncbi:outer envelope pore protein 21, chloroplastic-like isoform X2 [Phragmites australis]|uniref:outer envelope pore protein 21, chloroplastic-like isoform X2 n=1 Tax=Phragmites australis TaxID=29695 RepID=UPI002D7772A6|nr:outer envelope pore protein 21, chloroplastic-like isoform X2 [Phragmites australis]